MNEDFEWGSGTDRELRQMESVLKAALTPVSPSAEFVEDLSRRLFGEFGPVEERPPLLRYTLLAAAGIASSLLIVITGVRATRALREGLRVLHTAKSSVPTEAAPPLSPAA